MRADRGNYEWAKTPAGVHPVFQIFSTAGRRAPSLHTSQAGTTQNSSQKCRHPTSQRNGNRSQGGWGVAPPAPHINVSGKCSTHRITNPMGDAMCGAFCARILNCPLADRPPALQASERSAEMRHLVNIPSFLRRLALHHQIFPLVPSANLVSPRPP